MTSHYSILYRSVCVHVYSSIKILASDYISMVQSSQILTFPKFLARYDDQKICDLKINKSSELSENRPCKCCFDQLERKALIHYEHFHSYFNVFSKSSSNRVGRSVHSDLVVITFA